MHDTALMFGKKFFDTYLKNIPNPVIVDIGSMNIMGSLRSVAPQCKYIGLDLEYGPGVDIKLNDPYKLPINDNQVDAVVCSSCFEHSDLFWVLFLEMLRITKPDGVIYIQAPANGVVHRYPVDSWRFFPDSGKSLEKWARYNNHSSVLLESFIGHKEKDIWRDFVMIFLKDEKFVSNYNERIINSYDKFVNAHAYGVENLINFSTDVS